MSTMNGLDNVFLHALHKAPSAFQWSRDYDGLWFKLTVFVCFILHCLLNSVMGFDLFHASVDACHSVSETI
jgi:hypothetical protein